MCANYNGAVLVDEMLVDQTVQNIIAL